MSVTLDEIRKLFPNANYAPDPACKRCGGNGTRDLPPAQAAKIKYLKTTGLPCICVFVEKDLRDFAVESLAETARQLKKELES